MNPDLESLPLRDIHLPDTVAWWPIAPGWWIIILLTIIALAILFYIKHRKEQRKLRCAGITMLEKIILQYESHQDVVKLVADVSILLRRLCISHCSLQESKQKVANLTGKKWLAFLERGIDNLQLEANVSFISGIGGVLITVPYQSNKNTSVAATELDVDSFLLLCRAWINALPIVHKRGWWINKSKKQPSGVAFPA